MTATHTPGQTTATTQRAPQDFTQPVQQLDLERECIGLLAEASGNPSRRAAKTLSKNPSMSVALLAVMGGSEIKDHRAHGSALLQTLRGAVTLSMPDSEIHLTAGQFVTLASRVPHRLHAHVDSVALLVIANEAGAH